jgi:nitroreductase
MNNTIFNERRSVNVFDPDQKISREKLEEIINLSTTAPSAFNLEPWRIIAIETEEEKEKLFNLANQQPKSKQAPYTLIIIGDREGYGSHNPAWEELEAMAGEEATKGALGAAAYLYGSSEERKIKFAESNAGLLSMSIMYAAKSLGVDTHAMSGVDFAGIKESFGLKESEEVVMLIGIGYHDQSQPVYPKRNRKTFKTLVEVR